jgi:hypothetical protein
MVSRSSYTIKKIFSNRNYTSNSSEMITFA